MVGHIFCFGPNAKWSYSRLIKVKNLSSNFLLKMNDSETLVAVKKFLIDQIYHPHAFSFAILRLNIFAENSYFNPLRARQFSKMDFFEK